MGRRGEEGGGQYEEVKMAEKRGEAGGEMARRRKEGGERAEGKGGRTDEGLT